jgi:branched-chain amino acid transport system permease protein
MAGGLLLLVGLIPLIGEPFYTRLASRILIYGLAALSLDLILGYGGMVSLGHAAFLGIGAYTVGVLGQHGVTSAWIVWPAALVLAAAAAALIGALSLRTAGAYFIMITLAFAQMIYFFLNSLDAYGGADGMALAQRSSFGGGLSIEGHTAFFYLVWAILSLAVWAGSHLVRSAFGVVIQGIRENEPRMRAIGYPTFRYKLVCFVIAGTLAGLAGVLLANQSKYISPALTHWTRSGDILVMVILGGMGSVVGPVLGAAALLLAEEILSGYTQHWMIILGPLLIVLVLFAKKGLFGIVWGRRLRP